MGLIIGNAYKGDNFQKIVSPKQPIPYHTFEDLETRKITMFTIPSVVSVSNWTKLVDSYRHASDKMLPGIHCLILPYESDDAYVPTEIFGVSGFLHSLSKLTIEENESMFSNCSAISDLSEREKYILNMTALLPFTDVVTEIKPDTNFGGLQILLDCRQGNEAILAKEDEILFFQNLNNTKHSRFQKPLSFGRENVDMNLIGIKLKGWIPHNFIQRLYSAGFVSYLEHIKTRIYRERGTL